MQSPNRKYSHPVNQVGLTFPTEKDRQGTIATYALILFVLWVAQKAGFTKAVVLTNQRGNADNPPTRDSLVPR